jgi:cysteinyl-tRNA synthetase
VVRLHDTATGEIRELALRDPGAVSLYVCGPTVDNLPHIGHGRFTLVFDVLRRYLRFCGLRVHFVSNVTDIDDKIIARAATEGRSESEVAAQFEAEWWSAMDGLGVLRPDETPHATAYVADMVALIGRLVDDGVAYETEHGVYLDTGKVDGYGLLAHQSLDSLRSGARVEADEAKRSPLDFVLWKRAKPGEPTWESPFGPGRPGWHTECVVMSLDLLGPGFDLHGGAIDLIFPHHENERAQAVADGTPFARHWVHNGWVMVGGEKMSKSLGNFTSLKDLLARADGRAYRLLVLRSHYRSPIEVTPATIADAEKSLERLDTMARRFGVAGAPAGPDPASGPRPGDVVGEDAAVLARFSAAMDDDLNTPEALAGLFDAVSRAHALADAGRDKAASALARSVALLAAALGLALDGGTGRAVDEESAALVDRRDAARSARDWATADQLRDELTARGWTVEDGPHGTVLR